MSVESPTFTSTPEKREIDPSEYESLRSLQMEQEVSNLIRRFCRIGNIVEQIKLLDYEGGRMHEYHGRLEPEDFDRDDGWDDNYFDRAEREQVQEAKYGYEKFLEYLKENPECHLIAAQKLIEMEYIHWIPWHEMALTDQEAMGLLLEYKENNEMYFDGPIENFLSNHKGSLNINKEYIDKLLLIGGADIIMSHHEKFPSIDPEQVIIGYLDGDRTTDLDLYGITVPKLNDPTISKLLDAAEFGFLVNNLGAVRPEKRSELIISLVRHGYGESIINSKYFNPDQSVTIYKELLEHDPRTLISQLEKFPDLDHNELLRTFFNRQYSLSFHLLDYWHKFKNLNSESAMLLLDHGHGNLLRRSLDVFNDLSQKVLHHAIVKGSFGNYVLDNIDKFNITNKAELARDLLINGYGRLALEYKEFFDGIEFEGDEAIEIAKMSPQFFIVNFDRFKNIDEKEVIKGLLFGNRWSLLFQNLEKFKSVTPQQIVDLAADAQGLSNILPYKENLSDLDPKYLLKKFIEFEPQNLDLFFSYYKELTIEPAELLELLSKKELWGVISDHVRRFPSSMHEEIADMLIKKGESFYLLDSIQNFDINRKKLAHKLMDEGRVFELAQNLEHFPFIDNITLAEKLIDTKSGDVVLLSYLNKFTNLSNYIALKLINHPGWADGVGSNISSFRELDITVAKKLIVKGYAGYVLADLEHFKLDQEELIQLLISNGQSELIIDSFSKFTIFETNREISIGFYNSLKNYWAKKKFNEHFNPPLDKILHRATEIFGEFCTEQLYISLVDLDKGIISPEMSRIGITETGANGIAQLERRLRELKDSYHQDNFDPQILLDVPMIAASYKKYIRFEESGFGRRDDGSFRNMIRNHLDTKADSAVDLSTKYKPSEILSIKKVDIEKQEHFEYSEHFLNRFKTIRKDLIDAQELVARPKPFSRIAEEVVCSKGKILDEMIAKLDTVPNEKARASLQARIEQLKDTNPRNVREFQKNFKFLSSFTELHPILRKALFSFAFSKHDEWLEKNLHLIEADQPALADISWMLEFVEQIVNKETFSQYFTDQKSANEFRKVINIRSFEEELVRVQNQKTRGQMSMQFIPTRGMLLEFSGHIADACWAGKFTSIAEQFPNISALIMVQNPNTKHQRAAGACLLIETVSENDEPLLVIRGLNPQENIINTLSVEDFWKQIKSYVKLQAEQSGRKAAVVIDDYRGGACTNREVIMSFLKEEMQKLTPVTLKSREDTTFNNYNITHNSYIIN